jgi:hypothetical protein
VSSRKPADIPAFNQRVIETFSQARAGAAHESAAT